MEIALNNSKLWRYAWWLSLGTIGYNLIEGVVSVWLGLADETLALFGFGADSFIEVISAVGIAHMVMRLQRHGETDRDNFERTALRVTGFAFYALSTVLVSTAVISVAMGHAPDTAMPGVVVALVSIGFMWALIRAKVSIGTELNSQPIIADANCAKVCLRMSIVLLISSAIYELTGFGFIDAIGGAVLAWFSFKEGRECFEKAKGADCGSDCC